MYTTNLRKVGGSIMLAIPPAILELLHLHAGAMVELAVDHGRLVVDPKPKKRYSLDELLAQCNLKAEINAEDRAWLNDKPEGKELF